MQQNNQTVQALVMQGRVYHGAALKSKHLSVIGDEILYSIMIVCQTEQCLPLLQQLYCYERRM
jgi:hypothetical protein